MRFWAKSNARIFLQIQYFVGMFWHNDTLSYCAGCYTSSFTQNKLLCNSTYILTSTKYLIACFYKTSNVFIKPKNQVKNIKSNEMQEYWDFFLFFVLVWYSIAVKLISLWKKNYLQYIPILKLPFSEIFWHALIPIIPHRNCDNEEYTRIIEYTGQYRMHLITPNRSSQFNQINCVSICTYLYFFFKDMFTKWCLLKSAL